MNSSMEVIPETQPHYEGMNASEKSYNRVTMSTTMRNTTTKMQMRNRKEKGTMELSKSSQKPNKVKEADRVKAAFLKCYEKEFERRRDIYLEQKAKKENAFREIEQLKTSKRLLENKISKSKKSSKASLFPLNIEIGITSITINDTKEITKRLSSPSLGLLYKIDNGKQCFDSPISKNLSTPNWPDSFSFTLLHNNELMFQLILTCPLSSLYHPIDSFDIRANEIAHSLKSTKFFKETIPHFPSQKVAPLTTSALKSINPSLILGILSVITNNGNEYEILVKKKSDDRVRVRAIERKI